ncbi:MAG: RagB/SusD family nutrient uptake outer membrane protein [Tannerella sp.]|jgi:hypothetical protein|nr:RagB/SusD family nutrient uptake outer membrane protein [Tannerella sp.]
MKKTINIKNGSVIIAIALLSGCSDSFLDRPPLDTIVDANFYQTDDQVMSATALLYNNVWFDYNDKATFTLADFRGGSGMAQWAWADNIKFATTPQSAENLQAWRAFFNVIGQANTAIVNINRYSGPDVSDAIKQNAIGEAHFMRSLAYRYLVMNYGPVPIITDNQTLLSDPLSVWTNTVQSVWKFITNEMREAVEKLSEMPYAPGRVTKWSAEGMLARFYLSRAGVESEGGRRNQQFLDSAKYYADRVIKLSGKTLLPTYRELFLYPYDNNNESLFELQWVYMPTNYYGYANSTISQIATSPTITGNGDGWGGDFSATFWMLSLYEGFEIYGTTGDTLRGRTLDQRLHETFMLPGFSYPEITRTIDGVDQNPFVYPNNAMGSVLDGYVDNGTSPANIKKYLIGQPKDIGGGSGFQNYPNNTYMLRLAEMYLTYADAALGNQESTDDPIALQYINTIRTRARLPVYDVSRQGPLTFDKIFKERICEFAMEAMSWYDLINLHYWNPQKAFDIINSQYRGLFVVHPDKFPDPTEWTIFKTEWSTIKYPTANEGNFLLPIPASEATAAPNLAEPPVDYYAQ